MAKYCVKCGKALPEGVEICPDCNALGQSEADAALFTMLSSAEIWRESEEDEKKKRERARKRHQNRKRNSLIALAVALALVIAFLVLWFLPVSQVQRAIDKGEYETALSIWSEKLSDSEPSSRTQEKLLAAGERVLASLAARELSNEEARSAMSTLEGFGDFTASLFADVNGELDALFASSESMSAADRLFAEGEYLAACNSYLKVDENDALYADAQKKLQESLEKYADSVIAEASALVNEGEYTAAIECLKQGDSTLADYGTFSADIDAKTEDCYGLYEQYILDTAKALADTEDFVSARETVRACVEDYGFSTEALVEALRSYSAQADRQLVEKTISGASDLYAAGSYKEVFESLEGAMEGLDSEDKKELENSVADYERLFAHDMCAEADEVYGGDRHQAAKAIEGLEAALEIRELREIKDKIEALETFLPFDLVSDAYSEKEGEVNRNSTDFKPINVDKYAKWMWGRDGTSISFELDAEYDVFEAVFAVRGDKEDDKTASIKVYGDGEVIYSSTELNSGDEVTAIAISVDVTGVKVLRIEFSCDYEASPSENGYSYHALCIPEVYRKDK